MSRPLPVPHHHQLHDGYCLPACVQMVLAYWGIERQQDDLARQLQTIPAAGTPARRVCSLASDTLRVTFQEGTLADLQLALSQNVPPILLVHTAELPYWSIATAHAIVLLQFTEDIATVSDPGVNAASVQISTGDLALAWDRMANLYIWLQRQSQ